MRAIIREIELIIQEKSYPSPKPPLCKTNESWLIGTQDRHKKPLATVLCQSCGLAWTDPLPTEDEMKYFYEKTYREEYKGTYKPKPKHTYRAYRLAHRRFCKLKPHLSGQILDFGCGGGEFLKLLEAKGYEAEGIEPNQGYGEYARDELELPVTIAFVQDELPIKKEFDAITMFHVLEHLRDPISMIKLLASHLKENGKLIIEVPNLEEHCHAPMSSYHYAHLFHYSKETLEKLANLCGLKLINTWTSDLSSAITVVLEKTGDESSTANGSGRGIYDYLKNRSKFKHYLRPIPYKRALNKWAQYLHEWRCVNGVNEPKDALQIAMDEV